MYQLSQLKSKLKQQAILIYSDMRGEIDEDDYQIHDSILEEILITIDSYDSSSDLIKDISNDKFAHIGIADEETEREFFTNINN
jgi:hypothetical protein